MKTKLITFLFIFELLNNNHEENNCNFNFPIALQGTASAQLGGILNKAKEKVKKEAQKQEEKIVGTEKTDPIQEPANASAQADDIDPILGVSMSALNKSYENLDYNIYIYPHRPIPGLYYTKVRTIPTANSNSIACLSPGR